MTLVEKFEKFCAFLRSDKDKVNAIQSMENACTCTNMNIKTEYRVEEMPRLYNRCVFTGWLVINGIFISRCVGGNKKELKHEVYNRGLEILKTKPMSYLNDLTDPGSAIVKSCVERHLKLVGQAKFMEGAGMPVNMAATDLIYNMAINMDAMFVLHAGLLKLVAFIKQTPSLPDNPIAKLEQSFIASKCNLQHQYTSNRSDENSPVVFHGKFVVEDTCIALASNSTMKQTKLDTYTQALEALETKSIGDLLIPETGSTAETEEQDHVDNEAIVMGVFKQSGEGPPPITQASMYDGPLAERFATLSNVLAIAAFTDDNVELLDNCLFNAGLRAKCVYRKRSLDSDDCAACEVYIENYFISAGYGHTKEECTSNAYNSAYDVLTMKSHGHILKDHKKITPEETADPSVLCEVSKGFNSVEKQSNHATLLYYGFDPKGVSREISGMIVIETPHWQSNRRQFAWMILQQTAALNGLLLEWTYTHVRNTLAKGYKYETKSVVKVMCQLMLNGVQVADHVGYGKNKIRNFASSDYLFHLYERNTVVEHVEPDDKKVWVNYSDINKEAAILRQAAKEVKIETNPVADKHIVQAVKHKINSYFPRTDGQDLVFGPGIGVKEMAEIQEFATTKNLKFTQKFHEGSVYCSIEQRMDIREIAQALQSKSPGEVFANYRLVSKMNLPKHSDIMPRTYVPAKSISS